MKHSAAAILLAAAPCPLLVSAEMEGPGADGWRRWWQAERMLDADWRDALQRRGIGIGLTWIHDWSLIADGGRRRGSAARGLAEAELVIDLETLAAWDGAELVARAQWQEGSDANAELAGDLQVFDNLDAPDREQVSELFLAQDLREQALRLVLGKIDANGLFAASEHAAVFMNSSMGFSPTIVAFPSYPDPAFGLNVVWAPADRLDLRLGLYDGALAEGLPTGSRGPSSLADGPTNWFLIAEAGLSWTAPGGLDGAAALGLWRHTADFDRFDGGSADGTWGWYAYADQWLWQPTGERGLAGFLQVGWAEEEVSELVWHLGGGLSWYAPFAAREADVAGLGLSHVVVSDAAGLGASGETAWELFYTAAISGWWSATADLQFIQDPGADGLPDLWALTLRNQIDF